MKSGTFYLLANFMLIFAVILHMIGYFLDYANPSDDTERHLFFLMDNLKINMWGLKRTVSELQNGYSLLFASSTLFFAVINLSFLNQARNELRIYRRIVLINIILWIVQLIILLNFLVLPTIILISLVLLLFLICLFSMGRPHASVKTEFNFPDQNSN